MRDRNVGTAARTADGNPLQMPLWSPREATPGWHVRISRRARRLSMRVFPGGRVEVVVPPGVGIPVIERFVARHREWAERRAGEFALLAPHGACRRPSQVELALPGRSWQVAYETARRASVQDEGDGRAAGRRTGYPLGYSKNGCDGAIGTALRPYAFGTGLHTG